MDPIRIDAEIAGRTYALMCKPWPYKIGRRWVARLVALLAPMAAGAEPESEGAALAALFERLDPAMLEELADAAEAHTDAIALDEAGEPAGKAQPLSKLAPLLAGRYDVTLRVVRCHVELQFAPFFASLRSELAGEGRPDLEGRELAPR